MNYTFTIKGITENNRKEKLVNFEKALICAADGKVFEQRLNKSMFDDSKKFTDKVFTIHDFTRGKIEKALRTASFALDVPLKSGKGESFVFKAQEELTDRWVQKFTDANKGLYDLIINYLDLPEITVMTKAMLIHKGKVIYNPETGKPLTKAEWEKMVKTIENYINKHYSDAGKKIVLDSVSLGHLLDKMAKTNSLKELKKIKLEEVKHNGKTFDWISESVKNMTDILGDSLTRDELSRIQVMQQSAAQRITGFTDKMQNDVKQILIDSVRNHEGKNKVSQRLFDKLVGCNRDIQKIADTEIQNNFNHAYIAEQVYKSPDGEKVYFKRIEVIDEFTCDYCRNMNGKIAVWSNTPLTNDNIQDNKADFAMWEGNEWTGQKLGKGELHAYTGVFHPYCRGCWQKIDAEDIGEEK